MPVGITDPPFTVTNEDTFPRCFNRQAAVIRQASDFICGTNQPAGIPSLAERSSLKRNYSLRSPFGQHGTTFLQRRGSRVSFSVCVVSRLAFGIERHATRGRFTV